jgi:triacylglycerol lipase
MSAEKYVFGPLKIGKRYHPQNALSLAFACQLSYESEKHIISEASNWGFSQVRFLEITQGHRIDMQCYVMADHDNIVIVFRGNDDIKDWLANFTAITEAGPFVDSNAHKGFQDALEPAAQELNQTLNKFGAETKKIWITGHSFGGALASLYAGMLISNDHRVYGVYTFGSPRAGDETFVESLNNTVVGPHYRVVNAGDIVVHLPPEPFYSHAGKRIILKREKRETSKQSWLLLQITAVKEFFRDVADFMDITDNHRLDAGNDSYIPRLKNDAERVNGTVFKKAKS